MQIGILGAGIVGTNIGKAFGRLGHHIMLSSREPQSEKMQSILAEVPNSSAGTVEEVVNFGELIVIAIAWQNGLVETLKAVPSWEGKILMDTTNLFNKPYEHSAAEEIAKLTGAPLLKAFNTIGAEHMAAPMFGEIAASMFIAGDEKARQLAAPLIADVGFDVVEVGGLEACREIENLAKIWVSLARQGKGREFAFKLLRK